MDQDPKKSQSQVIHKESSSFSPQKSLEFTTPQRRIIYWVPAIFLTLGIVVLLLVLITKYIGSQEKASLETSKTELSKSEVASITAKLIKIDIEGAINQPGIYEMPNDSRIQDVLISAGGLSTKADRKYVSRYINLSQKITDTMKIYIPFEGEQGVQNTDVLGVKNSANTASNYSGTVININDASQSQLESLSGVGPVTAQKIISARPYKDVSELLSKKIIGKSLFDKLKNQLSIN